MLVATPSLESFTSRLMKEKWLEFKTEHLFYFRPSSLHLLFYRSGFASIRTFPHKKVLNLEYVESHFDRDPSNSALALMFPQMPATHAGVPQAASLCHKWKRNGRLGGQGHGNAESFADHFGDCPGLQ